jgi:DNA-binding protein YbaB
MFDKAKQLYQLQKNAREIKNRLKNTHIEAEDEGVTVIIDGEQNVVKVTLPELANLKKEDLEKKLEKCFNKAVKKSQQIGADLMKEVMGPDFNLPGMS